MCESTTTTTIAYRWRSLPRVRRHRASKPQSSSKRTGAALVGHHGPINMVAPYDLWLEALEKLSFLWRISQGESRLTRSEEMIQHTASRHRLHLIIIINDTLARSLEPVVTECKEHTIHTQTQIVASRKPKEIKHTHEGEANFTTIK